MAFETIPFELIEQTRRKISPYLVRTPIIKCEYFSNLVSEAVGYDVELFFKAELFQPTGSFKVRGAMASVLKSATFANNKKGVVTHSSGNLGAATAWAARQVGLEAAIVVFKGASPAKLANIAAQGAELVETDFSPQAVNEASRNIVAKKGYHFLSPYSEPEEVAGQATIAVEFLEDVPKLDAMMAPTSGGGLVSGLCVGGKQIYSDLKVFAVAPKTKLLGQGLRTGQRPSTWSPAQFVPTKCDALRAHPGSMTFPIMCELLEKDVFEVSDEDAASAMRIAWKQLRVTLEISSSTVIAAILLPDFVRIVKEHSLHNIGIVLSGGNVDLETPFLFN